MADFEIHRVAQIMNKEEDRWEFEKIQDKITEASTTKIQRIPICQKGGTDKIVWPHTKNGQYPIKL
ncbi:hypothetical protein COLO4_12791, partial [Corchorus olitorius]